MQRSLLARGFRSGGHIEEKETKQDPLKTAEQRISTVDGIATFHDPDMRNSSTDLKKKTKHHPISPRERWILDGKREESFSRCPKDNNTAKVARGWHLDIYGLAYTSHRGAIDGEEELGQRAYTDALTTPGQQKIERGRHLEIYGLAYIYRRGAIDGDETAEAHALKTPGQ